jgi:integrase
MYHPVKPGWSQQSVRHIVWTTAIGGVGMSSKPRDGTERYQRLLSPYNERQRAIFRQKLEQFEEYLQTEAKNPRKEIGYAETSVPPRIDRVLTIVEWVWSNSGFTTELTTDQADTAMEALEVDQITRKDGDPLSGGSKRKIADALVNWFAFHGIDWESPISFKERNGSSDNSDPFTRFEARKLWETALEYKSIPSYNNLSPEDRDRWRKHLAQELGKPAEEVLPEDWDRVNRDWKIPSIVRTSRGSAWRPAAIGRMEVDWYYPELEKIIVPAEHAVKNNKEWEQVLSDEEIMAIDKWLEQRSNREKYDNESKMWLTRESTPYCSDSLNKLLSNLLEAAGINTRGRKLTWYSWRHYVGTYTYDEYKDLKVVAERLRQQSESAASVYVHPTDELKKEVSELL